ncbi:SEC14-like protein 2 [Lytechinus variegatus]|uniref:SEC14-like protein 2 n=1 Tax=Lytechinus variegatus TaxID=7654 RepID=UPI001BB0ECA2|nr:SEC14-like protein 2 [Lytechinus variegatus]
MSGILSDLSAKQADALNAMRSNLHDVLQEDHDDHCLLRFLRARRFNVKKAEDNFRRDLEWRIKNRIDSIHEWYEIPEACLKYWPGGATGLDKEGHVVWICPLGNVDPKGLLYSVKAGDIIKTNISILERLQNEQKVISRKLGRHIEGVTFIVDLEHLNAGHIWKPGMTVMTEVAALFEEHYPEIIHKMLIVRPTKIFPAVYFILKPFLSEGTRAKIKVLGGNWRDVLLKHIDPEVLPAYWGGTMTDTDGNPNMCPSKINLGGKVPSFYFKKGSDLTHSDMTSQQLPGKRSIEVKYKVKTLGSIFRYEFKTESHDIAFGIHRLLDSGEKISILDEKRYNSHIVPEDGEVLFEEPGLYVVKFDNHGSTFQKTRKLSYWMEVIEPRLEVNEHMMTETFDDITRDSGYLDDRGPMSRHRSTSFERSSTLPRLQTHAQGPMKGLSHTPSFS